MEIGFYRNTDRRAWDNYIKTHQGGTFFHLSGWKHVVEKCFGHECHYLLAVTSASSSNSDLSASGSKVSGILPLFSIKSWLFGRSMVSLPFATYGGILADNDEVKQALYERAVALTNNKELDYLEIRNESVPLEGLPVKKLYYVFKNDEIAFSKA